MQCRLPPRLYAKLQAGDCINVHINQQLNSNGLLLNFTTCLTTTSAFSTNCANACLSEMSAWIGCACSWPAAKLSASLSTLLAMMVNHALDVYIFCCFYFYSSTCVERHTNDYLDIWARAKAIYERCSHHSGTEKQHRFLIIDCARQHLFQIYMLFSKFSVRSNRCIG